jgi:hypothetical protein
MTAALQFGSAPSMARRAGARHHAVAAAVTAPWAALISDLPARAETNRSNTSLRLMPSEGVALRDRDGVDLAVERTATWSPGAPLRTSVYRLGIDRGSPNHGNTVFSKRVIAEI